MIRICGCSSGMLPDMSEMRERIGEQWLEAWEKRHPNLNGAAAALSLGGLFLLREMGAQGTLDYTQNGRPYFADSHRDFSITHTGEAVFCALAPKDVPWSVGLDAEDLGRISSDRLEALSLRWFGEEERRFFAKSSDQRTFLSIWTRKEAFVKRSGEGLRQIPHLDTYAPYRAEKAAFWTYWIGDTCITLCADEGACAEEWILFDGERK